MEQALASSFYCQDMSDTLPHCALGMKANVLGELITMSIWKSLFFIYLFFLISKAQPHKQKSKENESTYEREILDGVEG